MVTINQRISTSSSFLERPPELIFPHSEEGSVSPSQVSVNEKETRKLQEYSPELRLLVY